MRIDWRLCVALVLCCLAVHTTHAQENYGSGIDPRIVQLLEDQYPELFYPDFDLVKRYNTYAFGLGKRKPFSFGLGKRSKQFNFGLGKRREYGFGLGKRSIENKPVEQTTDNHHNREKRSVPEWNVYEPNFDYPVMDKRTRSYNFGLGKRDRSYSFGLGKRWPMDFPLDDINTKDMYEELGYPSYLELSQKGNFDNKRAKNPYSFGLGKRSYSFGLGKREFPHEDQLEAEDKRTSYKFGLGRRSYNFGLGKRSMSEMSPNNGPYASN